MGTAHVLAQLLLPTPLAQGSGDPLGALGHVVPFIPSCSQSFWDEQAALQGSRGHRCVCAGVAAAQLLGFSEGDVCNTPNAGI